MLSPEAEEAALLRGLEALDRVAGVRPVGWRAPMWEMSYASPAILARHGFLYDSSLMDADRPYRLATWSSSSIETAGPTLVELPIHWGLDDWEQYIFLPGLSGSGRIATPREVAELWTAELEALSEAGGLFVLVNHPFASGRASRARALETVIERAAVTPGLWIATAGEIAAHVETLDLVAVVQEPPVLPPPLPGTTGWGTGA
jgi:peptidoglycan/xylan/chitin deacetylase (PgdA/CDA1 family)